MSTSKKTPSVILLIDDDATTNFLHQRAIRKAVGEVTVHQRLDGQLGYEYLCATHEAGEEAPDFIFLDINMPRLDGWGFLERYHQLPEQWRQRAQLYMLTTSLNPDDHERASSYAGVRGVVDKILSADRFREIMAEA